jgi:glycosyltransferase involved in cell wall biosynthesis
MRILIVAMSDSVHTARWISQINDQGWDIHLFPSIDIGLIHPDLRNVKVHHSFYKKQNSDDKSITFYGIHVRYKSLALLGRKFLERYFPNYHIIQLKRVIEKIKPDVIHSMEIQRAGYLTLEVKKRFKRQFPPWIVTNWGSDIYLFGRLADHKPKIVEVLEGCEYYSCECNRDVDLARSFGFKGEVLSVSPNTGGFNLELIENLKQPGRVSKRKSIILKGYQNWAGRSLVGIRALERCAEALMDYEILIYSASNDVEIRAEILSELSGISIKIIPLHTPHKEMLKMFGKSRIFIGLSISDAISTSFLEAITMGCFPIQSWTSCANEWIEDGKTGILVPPEDPDVIEKAIRLAISDNDLVDKASEINLQTVKDRLDQSMLKPKVIEFYKTVFHENCIPCDKKVTDF